MVAFFLCLLSKENGFVYLGIIPLLLYFFTNLSIRKIITSTFPFLAIALLVLIIHKAILGSAFASPPLTIYENSLVGAKDIPEHLATVFTILLFALRLVVYPRTLSWDYSYNHFPVVNLSATNALISIVIHSALLFVAIYLLKRKNIFSFTILFYFITSFITSNLLFKISTTFGERFLFLPVLGFCIALPFFLALLFRVDLKSTQFSKSWKISGLIGIICILYTFKTVSRNKDWKNDITLGASGVLATPNSARAHFEYVNSLGLLINSTSDDEKRMSLARTALKEYGRGLEIYSENIPKDSIYLNKAVLYDVAGNIDSALIMYQNILKTHPNDWKTMNTCGMLLFRKMEYVNAIKYFKNAITINPDFIDAITNAGACYHLLKDYRTAITYYEKVFVLDPADQSILKNISQAYVSLGDTVRAREFSQQ